MDCNMPGFPVHHQPRSLLKLMSIKSMIPSNYLILCQHLLLLPSIFPRVRVCPSESVPASGGQSIWALALASVLLMNIKDWFPLGLTALISLQSRELSSIFSNTTVQKHQLFSAQLSLCSNSHIHAWLLERPWPSLDGLCWKSNVSAFEYAI